MFHSAPPIPQEEMDRAARVYSAEDEVNYPGKPRKSLPPLPVTPYRKLEDELDPSV